MAADFHKFILWRGYCSKPSARSPTSWGLSFEARMLSQHMNILSDNRQCKLSQRARVSHACGVSLRAVTLMARSQLVISTPAMRCIGVAPIVRLCRFCACCRGNHPNPNKPKCKSACMCCMIFYQESHPRMFGTRTQLDAITSCIRWCKLLFSKRP